MKVLIVFSSDAGSDESFWNKLTGFQNPTNVNGCGKLYVFNGKNKNYCDNEEWIFDALRKETENIINEENGSNEFTVLLHTQSDHDLQALKKVCKDTNISIFKKFSTNDDLYYDFIIKLAVNSPEDFNRLCSKLQEDKTNTDYLKTLFGHCNSYVSNENATMLHDFFANYTDFNDTNIWKELKAKKIDEESDVYKNIKALFENIKDNSVKTKIIISARESLNKILD